MKTTSILLVGILALCAQLQPATAAAGGKGECWGGTGRPRPAGSQGVAGLARAGGPALDEQVRPITPAQSQVLPWLQGTPCTTTKP